MWYALLYLMAGGIVGFLGGAWLSSARRGDEYFAARVLADTVRNVVHEFDPPRVANCPHPCCHQLLRLALEQYDLQTFGMLLSEEGEAASAASTLPAVSPAAEPTQPTAQTLSPPPPPAGCTSSKPPPP